MPSMSDIHDGIIVGTALVYKLLLKEEVEIVTKDKEIAKLSAVKTVW